MGFKYRYPVRWFWCHVNQLPRAAGCYAIYRDAALCYIGSSANIRQRLVGHGLVGEYRLKIKLSRRNGDWLMREYRLIQRLRPRDNKSIGTGRPLAVANFRTRPLAVAPVIQAHKRHEVLIPVTRAHSKSIVNAFRSLSEHA